jgi:broad specificity phosphatase PhoE
MPKKIILIRHGETEYNRQKKWQGWSDIPLNKAGRKQAQLLAHRLKHEVIDVLYTSDLKRAVETAHAIAKSVNLQLIKTKKLRERNIGILEGINFQESMEKYKDVFAKLFNSSDETFKGHGGESEKEVKQRIQELLNEIRAKHQEKIVAIVTHGGTKHHIIRLLVHDFFQDMQFGNTAITILKKDRDGAYQITLLSDTSHLQE